jgi:hypothetical protein
MLGSHGKSSRFTGSSIGSGASVNYAGNGRVGREAVVRCGGETVTAFGARADILRKCRNRPKLTRLGHKARQI